MIVVLRALKLGDLLVAVPALRAIRAHWPDQRVLYLCQPWLDPVLRLTGSVDELVPVHGIEPLPRRLRGAEVVVNLHGTGPESTRVLDALRPARRVGHRGHGWDGPPWREDLNERDRWCALLNAHGVPADPGDYRLRRPAACSPAPGAVIVHPGAAYGSKRWPADRFVAVAAALRRSGREVVITGGPGERGLAERVAEASGCPVSAMPLDEMAALVASAALVVCGDTGIAHLASAYATPSVVLFGPVGPRQWGPPADGPHVVIDHPGARRGEPFADDPDPALLAATVADVLDAARSLGVEVT